MYMLYNMILKIINQISSEKKARNIEPTHAIYKEIYAKAVSKGLSVEDVRNGLNELYLAGEIEVGDTLNDKYIRIL